MEKQTKNPHHLNKQWLLSKECISDPTESELDLASWLAPWLPRKGELYPPSYNWYVILEKNSCWHVFFLNSFSKTSHRQFPNFKFCLVFFQVKWNRLLQYKHNWYPMYFWAQCFEPSEVFRRTKWCCEKLELCVKKTAKFSIQFKHYFSLL